MTITRLLIANRGEIAIRIARAAAGLGIRTVAIHAQDDALSLHVRKADESRALPGTGVPAYLDIDAVIAAARDAGCDAVHPGYGFLSENAAFAERCAQAGVTPASAAAQARASAAQGRAQATALRAQCDSLVKALVALTGQEEPALMQRLRPGYGTVPQPEPIAFETLPAGLLAQRPDLAESAAAVTAAAADVRLTEARRYPRVALGGALGLMAARTEGLSRDGTTWTLGPLQVTFPVFDGGVRRADEAAARAAYAESVALYQARLRTAVREVDMEDVRRQIAEQESTNAK
jgi:outer membrane protein TolC